MPASPRPLDLVPHRRFNPLLRQWILVSPQRTDRPWQGETSKPATTAEAAYDPACYLCPGNARSGGARNPAYTGVFAFNNDFPALLSDLQPEAQPNASSLLVAEPERGRCRVICFHPNHSLTLARMEEAAICEVVAAWARETATLGELPYINHVQIFENRGAMMGASNPHPHCQIWATEHVPDEPLRELAAQQEYADEHHRCLLCDYAATELAQAERVVAENDVVISAAVIPGKRAPMLITRDMVEKMAPGSVIVDVAAERGGNCELTQPGKVVVEHDVTLIGYINLASTVPYHASQMYSRNVASFLTHLTKDRKIVIDTGDEITRETLVTQGGKVVNARVREFFKLDGKVS